MWVYQSHRVFKKFLFRIKEPKLLWLLACAGKPWPQDTPWTKAPHQEHDARLVFRLVSGQPSCLENTMASTLCWITATFMLGCGHPAILQHLAVLSRWQGLPVARHTRAGGSPQATTCKGSCGLLPKAVTWWCELQTHWSQGWAEHWCSC